MPPTKDARRVDDGPGAGVGDIATVLQALSDPVRLEIVRQLDGTELTCGQLELPVGKSTCSHHLKTLSGAGVIAEREEGVHKHLRLRREELDRSFPGLIDSVLRGVQAREPSRS